MVSTYHSQKSEDDLPAMLVDARATVNTAARTMRTMSKLACLYHCLLHTLTIVGKDSLDELDPCEQAQADCYYDQTDKNDVCSPYITDSRRCIAKVELADVDAYSTDLDELPRHSDAEAIRGRKKKADLFRKVYVKTPVYLDACEICKRQILMADLEYAGRAWHRTEAEMNCSSTSGLDSSLA
jgi:hypothetical protein